MSDDVRWWEEWKKPDGSPCTKWEMLRAFAAMRRRNRLMAKIFTPEEWLALPAVPKDLDAR